MKYLITEKQNNLISLKRRFFSIDELINKRMKEVYKWRGNFYVDYCDYGSDTFIDVVAEWVVEKMYYEYFSDMDDSGDEWGEIHHAINDYIEKYHSEKIVELYNKICNKP